MTQLHNRISRKELKQRILEDSTTRVTVSFYCYFHIEDPQQFRNSLYESLHQLNVFGRIYLATEGINAQVNVPVLQFDAFRDYLYSIEPLKDVLLNQAVDDGKSFFVLDIKVRNKIVADGIDDPGFDVTRKGEYLNAEEMNTKMEQPGTVVIDMRNHYEYEVGHFVNAVEIPSDTFREQLPNAVEIMKDQKDSQIILYCTGGIRCEKASAYLLHNGFKNVFHLKGGIVNYARQVREEGLQSKFIGKNFVFDQRLGERITDDIIAKCHQCERPADTHTNCKNESCHLLFIQCEECERKYEGCCSQQCLDVIRLPEEDRKRLRKGIDKGRNVFNKSRKRK